ncbi:hypothetical protein TNCV_4641001 [Trichonephila clavipes]|nr:hypothetical protein TNCV_4641001 [Trichonephila clavipes]
MLWGSRKLKSGLKVATNRQVAQHSGRPQTSRNAVVVKKEENLIMKNRCLTARKTSEQVKKELHLAVALDLLGTINAKFDFLRLLVVSENENAIEKMPFSKLRGDIAERDDGVERHSKISLLEVFLAVEEMLG